MIISVLGIFSCKKHTQLYIIWTIFTLYITQIVYMIHFWMNNLWRCISTTSWQTKSGSSYVHVWRNVRIWYYPFPRNILYTNNLDFYLIIKSRLEKCVDRSAADHIIWIKSIKQLFARYTTTHQKCEVRRIQELIVIHHHRDAQFACHGPPLRSAYMYMI